MAADEYEKTIAPAEGVLFKDKLVSRMTFYACVLMGAFFLAIAAGAAAQAAVAGAIGMGLFGIVAMFLGLTRSVLRTVVTREDVRVHWGLWGPRIPLSELREVRVRNASRQDLIAASREAGRPRIEVFQVNVRGPIVEIEWKEATGNARRAWIGATDAAALAAAIDGARHVRAAPPARARIGADAPAAAEELLSHVTDAEAQLSDRPRASTPRGAAPR